MFRNRLVTSIALGVVLSVVAVGEEKMIKQAKLPSAVQKTAEERSAGATVTGYTSEKINGAMVYTVDLVADGKTRGIQMDKDGNVLSVEQEVLFSELPADIQKAFSDVSSKGKLGAVSTVSENGTLVAYSGVMIVDGNTSHVRVKPKATADLQAIPAPGSSK